MRKHLIIIAISFNAKLLVFFVFLCPGDFVGSCAAHGHNLRSGSAVQQGVNVALALLELLDKGKAWKLWERRVVPFGLGQRLRFSDGGPWS